MTGSQRQNVRLATELVSHNVAVALNHYQIDLKLSKIIELMNNWFDLFNTRIKIESTPFKSPYGCDRYVAEQNSLLKEVVQLMTEIKCKSSQRS